jgi:hypothetical protein
VILNRPERTIDVKLVYYGPALSGKTTNLQVLHLMMPEAERAALTSLRTEGDRTLFFDFLPLQLEVMGGWTVRLKTYTVPGQVQYEATRRVILRGADGVAFIADSGASAETVNRTALQAMKANLRANGLDPRAVPIVLQYNKRDVAGAQAVEAMDADLDADGYPRFEAVATQGTGVRETFVTLATRAVLRVLDTLKMTRVQPARLREAICAAVRATPALVDHPARQAPAADPVAARRVYDLSAMPLEAELDEAAVLLQQAVTSAVDLAGDLAKAGADVKALQRRRAELSWLADLGAASASEKDLDWTAVVEGACRLLGADAASVLVTTPGARALEARALHGVARDPLNAIDVPGLGSLAVQVVAAGKPVLTTNPVGDLLFGGEAPELQRVRALVAVPIVALGRPVGLLTFMALAEGGWWPGSDDLSFARVAASLLASHVAALRRTPAAVAGAAPR